MRTIAILLMISLEFCSNSTKTFSGRVQKLTVIFVVDSRKGQSIDFINAVFQDLKRMRNVPEINIIFLNNKKTPFNSPTIGYGILDANVSNKFAMRSDYYYLFEPNKKTIVSGALYGDDSVLIRHINDYFYPEGEARINEEETVTGTAQVLITMMDIDRYLLQPFNCFAFYEVICEGCESGQALIEFDKLLRKYGTCTFSYVPLGNYGAEDIERICRNLNIHTDFVLLDQGTLEWWAEQTKTVMGQHPFVGTILVIDKERIVRYRTNRISELKDWLERSIAKMDRGSNASS